MSSKLWLAALPMCLATACETVDPVSGSTDPGFGEAVKYDMAIQVIDPDPIYDDDGAQPGDDGDRAAQAIERYRTDKVNDRFMKGARQGSVLTTTQPTTTGGPQ